MTAINQKPKKRINIEVFSLFHGDLYENVYGIAKRSTSGRLDKRSGACGDEGNHRSL
jgi:hypothetical protein